MLLVQHPSLPSGIKILQGQSELLQFPLLLAHWTTECSDLQRYGLDFLFIIFIYL